MKRADIEQMMKANGMKHIAIVYKETDPLGMFCELKSGYLCDYMGHRIDRNASIWGYLKWNKETHTPYRVPFGR